MFIPTMLILPDQTDQTATTVAEVPLFRIFYMAHVHVIHNRDLEWRSWHSHSIQEKVSRNSNQVISGKWRNNVQFWFFFFFSSIMKMLLIQVRCSDLVCFLSTLKGTLKIACNIVNHHFTNQARLLLLLYLFLLVSLRRPFQEEKLLFHMIEREC